MGPEPVVVVLPDIFFQGRGVGLSELFDILVFIAGWLDLDGRLDYDRLLQAFSDYESAGQRRSRFEREGRRSLGCRGRPAQELHYDTIRTGILV